nr:unnamed protein product [Digitaria exilis]
MAAALGRRILLLLAVAAVHHQLPRCALAGDPNILTDFVTPMGVGPDQIDGNFFTYTRLLSVLPGDTDKFTVSKATAAEFPALLGQASELLVVVQGTLLVGLVDAARYGTVYTAALETGDMFVFPKGMVHWQWNNGSDVARAFSAFGSASPGTISLPTTLFETGIDDAVLEKSFHTDEATVEELKRDLAPPGPSSSAFGGRAQLPRLAAALLCVGAAFSLAL